MRINVLFALFVLFSIAFAPCATAQIAPNGMANEPALTDVDHEGNPANFLASLAGFSPDATDPLEKPVNLMEENGSTQSLLSAIDPKTKKSMAKVVGGLALVVAILIALGTLFGKKKGAANGPGQAMEILARSALTKSHQMQLLRVGNRLLLTASSDQGVDTLAEISDPQEVLEIERMVRDGNTSIFTRTRQRLIQNGNSRLIRQNTIYEA